MSENSSTTSTTSTSSTTSSSSNGDDQKLQRDSKGNVLIPKAPKSLKPHPKKDPKVPKEPKEVKEHVPKKPREQKVKPIKPTESSQQPQTLSSSPQQEQQQQPVNVNPKQPKPKEPKAPKEIKPPKPKVSKVQPKQKKEYVPKNQQVSTEPQPEEFDFTSISPPSHRRRSQAAQPEVAPITTSSPSPSPSPPAPLPLPPVVKKSHPPQNVQSQPPQPSRPPKHLTPKGPSKSQAEDNTHRPMMKKLVPQQSQPQQPQHQSFPVHQPLPLPTPQPLPATHSHHRQHQSTHSHPHTHQQPLSHGHHHHNPHHSNTHARQEQVDNMDMKQKLAVHNENKKREKEEQKREKKREKEKQKREKRKQSKKTSKNDDEKGTSSKTMNKEEKIKKSQDKASRPKRNRFQEYITMDEVKKGLSEGTLFYGTLRVNAKKFSDAYITTEGVENDTYVGGLKFRNRAFHTDVVVFQIIPDEKEWKKRPKGEDEESEDEDDLESKNESLATALKESTSTRDDQGTIALPPFISPSVPRNKEQAEKEVFNGDSSESDSESDSDSDDEDEIEQEEKEKSTEEEIINKLNSTTISDPNNNNNSSDIEEDFVIVNNDDNVSNNNTPSKRVKKEPKILDISGLKQDRAKLNDITIKALEKGLYVSVKIVYVLKASQSRQHIGRLTEDQNNTMFATFTPLDQTLPRCFVFRESIPEFRTQAEKYKTLLVLVTYGNWKASSLYPVGKYASIFGQCGDIEPETRALLKEYHVDSEPFTADVMKCLPDVKHAKEFKVLPEDYAERRDLRDWIIVSIDPDTAKDLDDALSCVELPDGNFEVGVHIADVSHFVKEETALDQSAQERATTVYLVQRAIPMLPSLLCEDLCSLNFGVERFAFSVVWTITPEGEILKEWFGKSVIKSASRLTYGVAQKIIDGNIRTKWEDGMPVEDVKAMFGPNTTEHVGKVVKSVMGLREIARHMRKKRVDNGAFTIHPTKLAFSLDEKGNPVSTRLYQIHESNHLVEEFMLLANMQVAKRISTFFPSHSLLRRHPDPNQNKLEKFITFCAKHGFTIDSSSVGSLGHSIMNLKDKVKDPAVFLGLQMLSVRSMKLAEYFATGDVDEEDWRHYALNVGHYTHFTSPIRRYPDIVVHRLLQLSIEVEKAQELELAQKNKLAEDKRAKVECLLPQEEWLTSITKHCNEKKLQSRKAQERSDKVFLCVLLEHHPTECDAVFMAGGNTFIQCLVPMFGCEQRIYLADLKEAKSIIKDSYNSSKDENTIVWPEKEDDIENSDLTKSITTTYTQLSTIRVRIQVDKSKFPIDTKCILLHPNH